MDSFKVGLPIIAPRDARLFILGSLPGEASLSAQRYYAHPTNQFWRLLGSAIGEELQPLDYQARLARLAERKIGLWDVVAGAVRKGSLDQALRQVQHNPLHRLLEDFADLRAIGLNGTTAAKVGRSLLGTDVGPHLIYLPSSSAANTRPFAEKAATWAALAPFAGG